MFDLDQIAFPGLSPVSLTLSEGECVGLSGCSGSGKSRLLRAIADMDAHTGFASVDQMSAASMPAQEWRRKVALLPAESQWWCDRVGEHFTDETDDLSMLGFDASVMDWDVVRCSSGEKQRLGLLRCLQNDPRVLLLDEPTANLDPENVLAVESLVHRYLNEHGAACLWVSHNQLQLERVAGRRFEIIDGELEEVGA